VYDPRFLEHVRDPKGNGTLEDATHRAEASDAACGDRLALDLRVVGGVVADARFRVEGCPGAIAVGSALASLITGRAARPDAVREEEIERVLGAVPRAKRHALALGRRVLTAALASPVSAPGSR
jgi:nitrogen fixation NifU-like protein